MVETLLDRQAAWLSGNKADADIVVNTQCRLVRNLADFPFPKQCSNDERRSVETRVLSVLESLNMLSNGKFWSMEHMDQAEARFLAERRLIPESLVRAEGPRGVYAADDQSMSVAVNAENHVTIQALAAGQQLQTVWTRINVVDDTLASLLDYAFNDRLGFLTTSVGDLGTGLRIEVILHLPALAMRGEISDIETSARDRRHRVESVFRSKSGALGDLFRLTNASTLGRSEDELIFHVKHLAAEIVGRERESRQRLKSEMPVQLEDRVWRAVGVARGARLLSSAEALDTLSSLRFGVAEGHLDQYTLAQINEALVVSQNAHIELRRGHECDELTMNTERADFFRARFV